MVLPCFYIRGQAVHEVPYQDKQVHNGTGGHRPEIPWKLVKERKPQERQIKGILVCKITHDGVCRVVFRVFFYIMEIEVQVRANKHHHGSYGPNGNNIWHMGISVYRQCGTKEYAAEDGTVT